MARIFRAFPHSLIITRKFRIVSTGTSYSGTPGTGTLILTGYAPTVATPRLITPTTGALTLTGYAPTVAIPVTVTPSTGSLTLTGYAPAVTTPVVVTPSTGDLVLTGYAPTVTVSAPGVSVTPDTASLVLTGYVPEVLVQTPPRSYGVPHLRPRKRPQMADIEGIGLVAVISDATLVGEKALARTVNITLVFDARLIRSMFWGIEVEIEAVAVAEFQVTAVLPFDAEGWAKAIHLRPLRPAPLPVMSLFRGAATQEMRLSGGVALRCNGAAIATAERAMFLQNLVSMPQGIAVAKLEQTVSGRLPVPVGAEAAAHTDENEEQIVLLLLGLPSAHGTLGA